MILSLTAGLRLARSIMETIDVLTDGAALRDIEQSRADEEAGRYFTAEEMDVIMAARHEGLHICPSIDAREGSDGVLGIHSRAARGESVSRRKAAA
jgi:hypothetical protein